MLGASSDSGVDGDRVTNINRPTIGGRAEPNAAITIRNESGAIVGTSTADAAGAWAARLTTALADGAQTLQIVANRGGGAADSTPATLALTIDTVAPTAPTSRPGAGPSATEVDFLSMQFSGPSWSSLLPDTPSSRR